MIVSRTLSSTEAGISCMVVLFHITLTVINKENSYGSKRETKSYRSELSLWLKIDFSADNLQAIREWHDILKYWKGRGVGEPQPRTLYSARLSFKIEGEIKKSSDKQKLKEFITTKRTLKEMLKGPQGKRKGYNKKYLSVSNQMW